MDITGILKLKTEAQQVSDKFRKREFVLTDNSSQYPQHISFQLTQDRCGLLDQYNVGDEIKVHFNLRGREWTNPQGEVKFFNSLEAWKLDGKAAGGSGASNNHEHAAESFAPSASPADDLPF